MKTSFKVGDSIIAYGSEPSGIWEIHGKVKKINKTTLRVEYFRSFDGTRRYFTANLKQCRKLRKSDLNCGDKVSVYGYKKPSEVVKGTVMLLCSDGSLCVRVDSPREESFCITVHPKQCRRQTKKNSLK